MKMRPSHRQLRIARKKKRLNERRSAWMRLILANKGAVTVGCHTVDYYQVVFGKHVPGVPR